MISDKPKRKVLKDETTGYYLHFSGRERFPRTIPVSPYFIQNRFNNWNTDVVRQKRAVSVDTALRLARYFNTTAQFWLNLQTSYDLKMAQQSITTIENEILPLQVA